MNLVPVAYYHFVFFNALLAIVLIVFLQTRTSLLESQTNKNATKFIGFLVLFLILYYIGLRPINYRFGDMVIYDIELQMYQYGTPFNYSKDFLFESLKYIFAKNFGSTSFFLFCTLLYVMPMYSVSKKLFQDYWFYAFIMFVTSFSFWAYGVNGIRNGVATSVFLYGLTRDNKYAKIIILVSTFFIHKSMLIPILAYFLSLNYSNTKVLLRVWLLAIPLSFVAGGFFESFFLSLGFGDDKLELYLGEFNANEGVEIEVGFRWDFLVYSAFGIVSIWYYIIKRKMIDPYYSNLANMYIITNAVWVLVIRANYSNRFAYLSWFMMGLVIIYPLLKRYLFEDQNKKIGVILLIYFLFTYFLNIIST